MVRRFLSGLLSACIAAICLFSVSMIGSMTDVGKPWIRMAAGGFLLLASIVFAVDAYNEFTHGSKKQKKTARSRSRKPSRVATTSTKTRTPSSTKTTTRRRTTQATTTRKRSSSSARRTDTAGRSTTYGKRKRESGI